MNPFEQFADQLAAEVVARVTPALLEKLDERALAARPDPLLTVPKSAKYLGISNREMYALVNGGHILKAPGLLETKIRRSVLDAYGTANPKRKAKEETGK